MRIVVFVLSTAAGLAAITAAAVAVPGLGISNASVVPFLVALVALWGLGVVSGVVPATSMRDPATADGRRASRTFALTAVAVAVTAALVIIVPTVLGDVPPGVAALSLAAAALYIGGNAAAGQFLRRRADARRPALFAIPPLAPDYSRRQAQTTVVVSSSVLIVGVLFSLTVGRPAVDAQPSTTTGVATAVAFAAVAAVVMCTVAVVALSGRVRDLSGKDAARLKRINQAVLRGKPVQLTDEEREIAVRYAPYAAQSQRWSIVQVIALFTALLAINPPSTDDPYTVVIWIGMPILAAVALPTSLRTAARAEAFAIAHRGTHVPADAPGVGIGGDTDTDTGTDTDTDTTTDTIRTPPDGNDDSGASGVYSPR